ncbi:MAG TPA: ATP-dependent 6-phosphofructokinase [Spirochaetota bacterium]|nr:ATP-dependent 6-phosphofructokinase [Spirochaetota bacterium]HPC40917.1 ATP-dependent 6-phosphofructokinase [Spirochaetota bacterium]HPL16044.1 ATP-dependent 6-phosphofructokinase [Spirochaetota bacterium]HQF08653.1 ATP-dependent 6-phosphofructokinase [Spirochaetota bacterium]HQH97368.1 ATP-dependent 6-phosphofructokinase [Spirochaetota bacterium]
MALKRVGILTGGGDCSGLNAVIRAVTRAAVIGHNAAVVGIEGGFEGLITGHSVELTVRSTRDILTLGGTVLGTTNKGNPFEFRELAEDGSITVSDYSDRAVETFRKMGLDCLFVVGGEGTLEIGYRFFRKGVPVIGIPKTIDNDLDRTDYTFGYQTAVEVASEALDRLQTTGRSHQRVMILEVMGRTAGWIALESGISGGAHIILIPEIPYSIDRIVEKIQLREKGGSPFSIIMVAEGAKEEGGDVITQASASTRLQGVPQLGGVGQYLADQIKKRIDLEVRCTVLGHVQRGGSPCAFDRVLGTRLGSFAVQAAAEGKFGTMVALDTPDMVLVPLSELAGKVRTVPVDSQLIRCAESIGISMGR